MLLPVLAAAPAIILGHQFRSQTENSEPPIRATEWHWAVWALDM